MNTMPQLQEVWPLGKGFPEDRRATWSDPQPIMVLNGKSPKLPLVHRIAIEEMKPRVTLNVAGRTVNFLLDSGGAYSMLNSCSGALSLSLKSCQILRVER